MKLQGQSTLTNDEKVTEAKKHVRYLLDNWRDSMDTEERVFVINIDDNLTRYGSKTAISTRQLFWLRDLVTKY
jgi:hypothetical protein